MASRRFATAALGVPVASSRIRVSPLWAGSLTQAPRAGSAGVPVERLAVLEASGSARRGPMAKACAGTAHGNACGVLHVRFGPAGAVRLPPVAEIANGSWRAEGEAS